jgi:hypothetical protein
VRGEGVRDALFDLLNVTLQRPQHRDEQAHVQDRGLEHGAIGGERSRDGDALESPRDHVGAAAVMLDIKGPQARGLGPLERGQFWPALQEVEREGRPQIVAAEFECLGKHRLERAAQLAAELRAPIDGAAAQFVERGEFTRGGRVQPKRAQLLAVLSRAPSVSLPA